MGVCGATFGVGQPCVASWSFTEMYASRVELATTDCAVAGTLTDKVHVEIHGVDAPN